MVRKASPDLMMVVHMTSPDGSRDQQYISNYATLYVKDVLGRIDGVGNVLVFGARDYSMRVWLDPARVAGHNLTAGEVMQAMRAANLQVAAGAINQAPAVSPGGFTLSVQTLGRLTSPEEFGNIVLRAEPDGSVTRLRDVARIELGAQDYTLNAYLDNKNATALGIFQRPGSNALATSGQVKATMERLKKDFPTGLDYSVVYNPTEFIQASVDAVIETLFEALLLVVIVVILFLQTWRAAIIPLLAIPVSLIGSFAVMAAVGISFNTLSLFGLVLAIGIVVDDAIVVVENVERYLTQGMSPKAAAHKTMDEVGGALIAISLVLIAVFLPTAFITGLQGTFYKQFAITIAASTAISAFVSLTLSPAMAALLLKTHALSPVEKRKPTLIERLAWPLNWFFRQFNRTFEWLSNFYGRATARLIRMAAIVLVVYAGLLVLAGNRLINTPTGLVPQLDRSYLIAVVQLPAGATLERTDKLIRQASEMIMATPGVEHAVAFVGLDGATFTNAPNTGVVFVTLKPFDQRRDLPMDKILGELRGKMFSLREAFVFVLEPPSVPGIGTGGGLKGYVQDRAARGLPALEGATWAMAGAAGQTPGLTQAFTLFSTRTPQIWADIDRTKAEQLGVPIDRVFEALSVYMGSAYVNDFNILGRTYRVTAQADDPYRLTLRDVANLKTRSASGEMVPIGSVATFSDKTGPLPGGALQPLSGGGGAGGAEARLLLGTGHRRHGGAGRQGAAVGLRLRMDRDRAAGKARRRHLHHRLRPRRGVRVPAAGGPLRELAAAARRHPDRADVHPCRHDRRQPARARPQHPGRDRPGGAGRPRRQERHPDRGVRQAGPRGRHEPLRRRGERRPHAPAAHPHDLARLHPGRGAAGGELRRRRRDAPVAGHRGVLRHAGRHLLRPDLHAGLLCHLHRPLRIALQMAQAGSPAGVQARSLKEKPMPAHPALTAGRVAVVTGAASGIGLAAARRFASMGLKVCLADLSADTLERGAAEVAAAAPAGKE